MDSSGLFVGVQVRSKLKTPRGPVWSTTAHRTNHAITRPTAPHALFNVCRPGSGEIRPQLRGKTSPCFKPAHSGSVHHQRRNLARRIRGVLLEIIDCRTRRGGGIVQGSGVYEPEAVSLRWVS
jgi:hypothetical protein